MRPSTAAIGERSRYTPPCRRVERHRDRHNDAIAGTSVPAVVWLMRRAVLRTRPWHATAVVALEQIGCFSRLPTQEQSLLFAGILMPLRRFALPSDTIWTDANGVPAFGWAGRRTESEKPSFSDDFDFFLTAPRYVLGVCTSVATDVTDERFQRGITAKAAPATLSAPHPSRS